MMVPGIRQLNPSPGLVERTSNRCTACSETRTAMVALARTLSGQVSVTTAEGDRVTWSAAWSESMQGAAYEGGSRRENVAAGFQDVLVGLASRDVVGFLVEGQLNEQEVRDLTALFRTVGSIFDQFYRGQGEEGMIRTVGLAEAFGAWGALDSLNLDLHVQRSVTVTTAGQSVIDSAAPSRRLNTPGAAPQASAAIPPSSLGTTAPTQLFGHGVEQPSDTLAEQLINAVEAGRLRRHRLREFLAQILERADEQAKASTEPPDEQAAIAERARETALARVNEPAEPARVTVASFSYSRTVVTQSRYAVFA